jgi:hypothetical protein
VRAGTVVVLLAMLWPTPAASQSAPAGTDQERIWILPFTQSQPDPELEYLRDALPALLMAAVTGSDGPHAVIERENLNEVLGELSLSLEGLSAPATSQRVGRLLGATVMISGSFAGSGAQLDVIVRASDLETGVIAATAEGRGPVTQAGTLVLELYRRLAVDLGRPLPALVAGQVDDAPVANLHFMKGLGHYYSARYSHSLAEFMLAAEDRRLGDVPNLWLARAYLALRQYSQACLELTRLMERGNSSVPARDITAGMRECERHLSGSEMRGVREMAARDASRK